MIIIFWNCTKITFLILITNLNNVFVFLLFKTLYEMIIFVIKFIIFKLALKNSFSSISILIYTDKIMFIIKHVIILLSLIIFLNHYICKISIFWKMFILFHELLYYFFYLMQLKTATHISCIIIENLFQLIWIFLLIIANQLLFCFSCFFIFLYWLLSQYFH